MIASMVNFQHDLLGEVRHRVSPYPPPPTPLPPPHPAPHKCSIRLTIDGVGYAMVHTDLGHVMQLVNVSIHHHYRSQEYSVLISYSKIVCYSAF